MDFLFKINISNQIQSIKLLVISTRKKFINHPKARNESPRQKNSLATPLNKLFQSTLNTVYTFIISLISRRLA